MQVYKLYLLLYSSVRQNIERKRYHQKQFHNKRQCSICELPLGHLFNSGALCPSCDHRVCKRCRRPLENHSSKFLCNNCFEMGWDLSLSFSIVIFVVYVILCMTSQFASQWLKMMSWFCLKSSHVFLVNSVIFLF